MNVVSWMVNVMCKLVTKELFPFNSVSSNMITGIWLKKASIYLYISNSAISIYYNKCDNSDLGYMLNYKTIKPHNNLNIQASPHCFDLATNNVSS
jgi:hypothetical protein